MNKPISSSVSPSTSPSVKPYEYKFKIELDDADFMSPVLRMNANNWEDLVDKIFSKINIIPEEDF